MEIRCLLTKAELDEAARLSDSIFRDHEQVSMQQAFPGVFSESLGQSFGAFDNGKMVAFMGLVPTIIRLGPASLRVYSLGSVCTDENYRGKGIASELLDAVLQQIGQAGASLLLVSGARSLYTRAGCRTYGQVEYYQWDRGNGVSFQTGQLPQGAQLREWQSTDWFQLHALASNREVRFDHNLSELAQLIHCEAFSSCVKLKHKVVVAEKDGQIVTFAVVGVPAAAAPKRPPLLIEWAGDAACMPALLNFAADTYTLDKLLIPVPWHEQKLALALQGLPVEQKKATGTVLVASPERLLEQLAPYLQAKDASAFASLAFAREGEDAIGVTFKDKSCTLTVTEFISLLFDPGHPELDEPELTEALKTLFPLPLPYDAGLNYV
ncbi:GNAT family N-acetyltransferase [Paenibacillus senegalensis]|uniref:GNAT family N-acetyltransferase n=1 Tax=Paenibacillus senegalensis TaxID=1465766 RepID=UPI0002898FB5|nr:GNAT family N-acetyltransferase [Paenibacillus senegalensis]